MIKANDVIDKYYSIEPIIVNKDAEVNQHYGIEAAKIDEEMLNALKHGKYLYVDINCGEYALLLYYDGEENKNDN